jgi:hypothetical protein
MAEWAQRLEPGTWRTHVRIGKVVVPQLAGVLTAQQRALLAITLPEVDLVRTLPGGGVELVEFIIWRPHETLGQLLYYGARIQEEPPYSALRPDQLHLRIVTGLEDPQFRKFAEALGIAFEVFRPAWLEEALAARRGKS